MRFRFKIKTLLILTAIVALVGAYYVSVWAQVTAEEKALDALRRSGLEVFVWNRPIQYAWSWGTVRQVIDWPWHALTGKDLPCCHGVHLEFKEPEQKDSGVSSPTDGWLGESGVSLRLLQDCSKIEWLTLASGVHVTPDEICSWGNLPYLNSVNLENGQVADSLVDSLLQLKHLESVDFLGKHQITVESFNRFQDAEIVVSHYGLRDYRRDRNYVRYDGLDYLVDSEQAVLDVIVVDGVDGGIPVYRLDFETRGDRYTEDLSEVRLDCELDGLRCGWDDLVGSEAPLSPKWPTMADHYLDCRGVWTDVTDFSYRVVSREGNWFRVKGTFVLKDLLKAEVDAFFQLKGVRVYLSDEGGIAEGRQALLEAGFDPNDFEKPVCEDENGVWVFRRKPELCSAPPKATH